MKMLSCIPRSTNIILHAFINVTFHNKNNQSYEQFKFLQLAILKYNRDMIRSGSFLHSRRSIWPAAGSQGKPCKVQRFCMKFQDFQLNTCYFPYIFRDEEFSVSEVQPADVIHANKKDIPCIFRVRSLVILVDDLCLCSFFVDEKLPAKNTWANTKDKIWFNIYSGVTNTEFQ